MTSDADDASEAGDDMLRTFLRAQRESVLAIVEGLSEEAWHRSVVPTDWTPAGMLEHSGSAEWHWFQGIVAGNQPGLPGSLRVEAGQRRSLVESELEVYRPVQRGLDKAMRS